MKLVYPDYCYLDCAGNVIDPTWPYRSGQWEITKKGDCKVWIFDDDFNLFFEEDEDELRILEKIVSNQIKGTVR